jgi:hypothetical protein
MNFGRDSGVEIE